VLHLDQHEYDDIEAAFTKKVGGSRKSGSGKKGARHGPWFT
jgi:hypothetical protein